MSILSLALVFFIISNPIGNSPTIVALIKNNTIREQQKILLRECIFATILALFYLFLGDIFEKHLKICEYSLSVSGGILLLIIAFHMIFSENEEDETKVTKQNPFIVPIATPLLSGAGLLAVITLYAKQEANDFKILIAILIAFTGITAVMLCAPYLQVLIGKRGMAALEHLMGMILALMGMDMIVRGMHLFIKVLGEGN